MSFGGGGSQGTIRYALVVDDAQATQKLNTFKTNLNSVGASTNTLNKNMGALGNNFKTATGGLTQQNTLLGQTIKQHQTLGNTIKTNVSRFAGLATGLSATASGALQLAAGFRDYNDAQIAVDRVTRRLSLGQEALGKAQAKLNDLQKSGKASSADLAQAQLDVTQAQQQVEIQTQLVGEAQERLFDSQSQFVASIFPTVLGAVGSLGFAFKDLGGILPKVTGAFGALKGGAGLGGMVGILGPIGIAVAAVAGAFLLWKDATDKTQQTMEKVRQAGAIEDVTERVKEMNTELDKLKQPFSSPALNAIFNIGPGKVILEKSVEKLKELNKTAQDNTTVSGLLKTKQDELTKATENYNHALETRQTTDDAAAKAAKDLAQKQFDAVKGLEAAKTGTDDLTKANELYSKGATVTTEATDELIASVTNLNRAEDYQREHNPIIASQADEIAQNVNEQAKATTILNRAYDYQRQNNPEIISQADEIAQGINEQTKATTIYNRAQDYQRQHTPQITSQADELAAGMEGAATSTDKVKKSTAELIIEFGHATPLIDNMRAAAVNLATELAKRRKGARLELFEGFDVKTAADRAKDMIEKFVDKLPKKVKKKIKVDLDVEAKKEAFAKTAGTIIDGLSEELEKGGDDFDDAIAEGLKDIAPKGEAGEAFKDWLDDVIAQGNTGDLLAENIKETFPGSGEWVLTIPTEGDAPTFLEGLQGEADKNSITVPAEPDFGTEGGFAGGGFAGSLWGDKEPMEVPAKAKIDDVVIGNGVDPAQAAFDANPYTATINKVVFQNPSEIPRIERPEELIRAEEEREKGEVPMPEEMVLKVNNTQAIKAIDVVAKRIASLSTIPAMIKLINTTAIKATDVVAKRIFSLTTLQPSISLQNKKAIKANDVVANRIDSLTKIKPSISLQNNKAIKAVDVVAKRINSLGDINPTVNVQVKYNGIRSFQHGGTFMTSGPELIMVGDNPGGRERVSVAPTSTGASAGGHGTLVVHLHNVNSDRETVRTFRREIGKEIFRFGPS